MVKPIITLVIAITAIVVLQFFSKSNRKITFFKKESKDMENEDTAQNFINTDDIRKNFRYTANNMIFSYIRIYHIDRDLLTKKQQKSKTKILTKKISSIQKDFKFMALSKPTDISTTIQELQDILASSTDYIQREILRKEISSTSDYAINGEATERQFYIICYEEYHEGIENEMLKTVVEFISAFNAVGIKSEVLKEKDIYQLLNLITNPSSSNEEINISPNFSILELGGEVL